MLSIEYGVLPSLAGATVIRTTHNGKVKPNYHLAKSELFVSVIKHFKYQKTVSDLCTKHSENMREKW